MSAAMGVALITWLAVSLVGFPILLAALAASSRADEILRRQQERVLMDREYERTMREREDKAS